MLASAVQSTYVTGYANGDYGHGDFFYGPYVDGKIIRQLPSQEFKEGHFTKVPLLVNHDAYEGLLFSDMNQKTKGEEVEDLKRLFPSATHSFISQLFDLYPASDFGSTFRQRAKWFGDFIINCPTHYMARAVSDGGNPVYKFRFADGLAVHGAIAPYVETKDLAGTILYFSLLFSLV